MKNLLSVSSALILMASVSACSMFGSNKTTNVMQIGKDSYTVRSMSVRSTSDAKQAALVSANAFCKAQGNKNVMLVREFGGAENETNEKFYDLTFMCLQSGDKDFSRITRASGRSAQLNDGLGATDTAPPAEQNQ